MLEPRNAGELHTGQVRLALRSAEVYCTPPMFAVLGAALRKL
jgi:hypothetical protein